MHLEVKKKPVLKTKKSIYPPRGSYLLNAPRLVENKGAKQTRYNIMDEMVNSYNSYVQREMKLYVGCEDGMYNIYRRGKKGIRCRLIANRDTGVYEQILRETDQQEAFSNLGIGMDKSLPNNMYQHLLQLLRPESTSTSTQFRQSTAELETQTYCTGLNRKDMASQAVQDTMNTSVQAVQDTMNTSVQAVQDTMNTSVQAVQDTMNTSVQAVQDTMNTSVQAVQDTMNTSVQAVQDTMNTSVQAVQDTMNTSVQAVQDNMNTSVQAVLYKETQNSSVQSVQNSMNTSVQIKPNVADFASQTEMDIVLTKLTHGGKYSGMFYFSESGLLVGQLDGKTFTMNAMESSVILKLLKTCAKTKMSGDSEAVGAEGISNIHHNQSFPDNGDSQQGAAAAAVDTCYDVRKRTKKKQEDKPMFHQKVPSDGQLEKFLSKTSPFEEFGYPPTADIPSSLDDISIPVVESCDITYEKTEDNTVVLGRGGFGCVYFAKHSQFTVDMCVKEYEEESTTLYDIHHEAQILLYLQSTNCVPQCFGLTVSPFISTDVSLVQECFAKGYTLKKLLKDRPHTYNGHRKWIAVVYQLFWGLKMIHEMQVLINDIKTDNVLVNWQSDDMTNMVRYIDMGLATFRRGHRFSADPNHGMTFCENYAPEVRNGQFSTPASDVYAVGFMVDEISLKIGIIELEGIAQICTEDDPSIRPNCQFVLDKLEKILEKT